MIITTMDELKAARESGRITGLALKAAMDMLKPGVTTMEINDAIERVITDAGLRPAFKGYQGYKFASCISVNDEIVHAPPRTTRVLKLGDVVSIDTGSVCNGINSDAAVTKIVGYSTDPEVRSLVELTSDALAAGIRAIRVGGQIQDISVAIQNTVVLGADPQFVPTDDQFGIPHDYYGHGIGRLLHEPPMIPNRLPHYPAQGACGSPELAAGCLIAVEPMVMIGSPRVVIDPDGTVRTKSGKYSAHFEHTIWVTRQGPIVLTIIP